ncbi:hypothetical protein PGTUg99_019628 [Puccinia graminis f. sp. tritici]|uniref:Ubiquitin-like domain-containing protein n=1 Tax=Puccinia graminis f. sp. tritici TaxID=56615 RepID=A0A5B0S521_PUCGR|nr:hypothetical protein PGTUg99_019628 [Puccinia graminis f. sp. tritici]
MNQLAQNDNSPTIHHTTTTTSATTTTPTDSSHQSGPEELDEPIGAITTDTRTIPYSIPAVEPFDTPSNILNTSVESDNHVPLTFNIRFASDGSVPDLLNVWVGDRESVREFKRRIQLLRPSLASRRLRLIYLGRVLTDGTLLVPWTELLLKRQNSQLSQTETVTRVLGDAVSGALGAVKGGYDAAIGVKSKGKGKEVEPTPGGGTHQLETVVWLQCAVGEIMSPTMTNNEAVLEPPESDPEACAQAALNEPTDHQQVPLSGFDRLAEAGFSEEDIEQVRRQFHAEHEFLNSPSGFVDTDEEEHARAMEEQWLEGLNSTQDGVDNGMGSHIYSTLFKGLCIGFFFPIIPIFFFRTDLLDRRTQLAILSGSAINFLFGVLQYTNS